jgi:sec-independent protein translocase protein TatA
MGLKMSEILLILAALLLLFGASRLPQLGSSLGSAIRNFKKGFAGDGDEGGTPPAAGTGSGQIATGTGATTAPQGDKAKQS